MSAAGPASCEEGAIVGPARTAGLDLWKPRWRGGVADLPGPAEAGAGGCHRVGLGSLGKQPRSEQTAAIIARFFDVKAGELP